MSATAYHEAAHSVICYRLNGWGESVSIVPEGDSLGRAHGDTSDSTAEDHMEGRILSLYAGGHAQRKVDPGEGEAGCSDDDGQAENLLREWGWEDREQELRERSLALVRQHWNEITAVAEELLRLETLDETEVMALADGDSEGLRIYRWLREGS